MKHRSGFKVLIVSAAVAVSLQIFTSSATTVHPSSPANDTSAAVDPVLTKIAEYKKWNLVNPRPELMEAPAAQLCAAAIGRSGVSPHLNKYISVYVNPEGSQPMLTQRSPRYPVGTIVVKEKLAARTSQTPELLTVMLKHEQGYDPASGDWEYLVLDGTASTITQRGRLASCNACHTAYQDQDFVTRTYLPAKIREALK